MILQQDIICVMHPAWLHKSSRVARALTRNAAVQNKKSFVVGDLVVYRRDTQQGGTVWSTASRAIGVDPHNGIWLLHEGVPVLCAAGKLRSANESESLAYSILNNIPVFPEAVTLGQQKYIRMMDEEASPKKGHKREAQAEDKTGKAARSSASASASASAVPMTPGGIVGDDEVMLAMVDNEDHWRISESHAIRVHNKRRFHDFHPLYDGDVPEGFGGRRVTRKVYEDGSRATSESMPGMDNVDSRAWTGFTVFSRVRHPLVAMAAFDDAGNDTAEFRALVAQRFGEDSETQAGKVPRTLQYERCTPEMQKLILAPGWQSGASTRASTPPCPFGARSWKSCFRRGMFPSPCNGWMWISRPI